MPVPWISPVCMIRPSERANVSAPGAARRLNTDSRATYSMSMKSGSLKPHRFTKVTMSVSDTVLPSVRKVAPTSCCSKVKPWLRIANRRVVPPVHRLPRRDDIDHAHPLEAALVGVEPAEDRLVRSVPSDPGFARADEDHELGRGGFDLLDHLP